MNEWMKYLMDLLHNLILVEISFWKEQENHNNIYCPQTEKWHNIYFVFGRYTFANSRNWFIKFSNDQ